MHLDIQVDRAEEGWVCDVLLEPGPPTAREGCFLSMDPGLVTMKDAWTLFPLHPEHDAVVPPKEEIHVMAQGHLQGGTPSLWGFTFQEAACDQWVLRPRVWTAHSPIKMTVYNCGHKPLHIGPSTRLGLALFWPAEPSTGRRGAGCGRQGGQIACLGPPEPILAHITLPGFSLCGPAPRGVVPTLYQTNKE